MKKSNNLAQKNPPRSSNFQKRIVKNQNSSFILEKESTKRLEFNKIELEIEETEKIEEECDKYDRMLGPYLRDIFNYVRDNEVFILIFKKKIESKFKNDSLAQVHTEIQLHFHCAKGYQREDEGNSDRLVSRCPFEV